MTTLESSMIKAYVAILITALVSCASVDAENMTCFGFCSRTEFHKDEAPEHVSDSATAVLKQD